MKLRQLRDTRLKWLDVYACIRTASALLIGNSIVVPVLSNFENRHWWILLGLGVTGMLVSSIEVVKGAHHG